MPGPSGHSDRTEESLRGFLIVLVFVVHSYSEHPERIEDEDEHEDEDD